MPTSQLRAKPRVIATRLDGETFYGCYTIPLRTEDLAASAPQLFLRVFRECLPRSSS